MAAPLLNKSVCGVPAVLRAAPHPTSAHWDEQRLKGQGLVGCHHGRWGFLSVHITVLPFKSGRYGYCWGDTE